MPFYDFTRSGAKEFSLAELVAKISELERRRQRRDNPRDETPADGSGNPWQSSAQERGDGAAAADQADRLLE